MPDGDRVEHTDRPELPCKNVKPAGLALERPQPPFWHPHALARCREQLTAPETPLPHSPVLSAPPLGLSATLGSLDKLNDKQCAPGSGVDRRGKSWRAATHQPIRWPSPPYLAPPLIRVLPLPVHQYHCSYCAAELTVYLGVIIYLLCTGTIKRRLTWSGRSAGELNPPCRTQPQHPAQLRINCSDHCWS